MIKIEFQDGSMAETMNSRAQAEAILARRGLVAGATYDTDEATVTEYWLDAEQAEMEPGASAPVALIETTEDV